MNAYAKAVSIYLFVCITVATLVPLIGALFA